MASYLPSYAAEFKKRDWRDDRVVRRNGSGAKLLDRDNLAAEFQRRNYSEEAIGKILGGNMMRVFKKIKGDILNSYFSSRSASGS